MKEKNGLHLYMDDTDIPYEEEERKISKEKEEFLEKIITKTIEKFHLT